jgi:hypothetical protein
MSGLGMVSTTYKTVKGVKTANDMADAMDAAMRNPDGTVDYSATSVKWGLEAAKDTFNEKMDDKVDKAHDIIAKVTGKGEALMEKENGEAALDYQA